MPSKRVVQVAAEAYPFAKVGGLGDVIAGLSRALAQAGHEVTLVLPLYRQVPREGLEVVSVPPTWQVQLGPVSHGFGLRRGRWCGGLAEVLFVEHDHFFDRWSVYNAEGGKPFADDAERWLFFQKAAIEALRVTGMRPDVIHLHDSQTGLIPGWLRSHYAHDEALGGAATVFTIHNLAYQGTWPAETNRLSDLPAEWMQPGGPLEFHGACNWMKAGIVLSDAVTTVSPTYADETCNPDAGHGLDGVLRARRGDYTGVLNGIDDEVWNPASDPHLVAHYTADDRVGKRDCKRALLEEMGLPERLLDRPLLAFIGRLVPQKGCELFQPVLRDVLQHDVGAVFLGSGANLYEDALHDLRAEYPGQFRARIGFDDALAHRIEAGADVFLMPSRYEPCGLNQMYSMAYGTVPVVHATGGLADTVRELPGPDLGTGFVFHRFDAEDFKQALYRALAAYQDRASWERIVDAGMRQDLSWRRSARRYLDVYERVAAARL
ncbi:MAG: glycogen synthase GlgA [Vicinamibacteria bacterium]|nr:glycogen synthase GlgA [Vicinamibacteria bacterium]